jgi:tetratricopeptide (TPR) repeat protein
MQGRHGEAEPLFREALAASRETLGDRHPNTLFSISNMAELLRAQGRLGEAEPLFQEALAARHETLGDRHPDTLVSINNMAGLLQAQGRLGEAEPLCREALAVSRETLGDRHPSTLASINNMAQLFYIQRLFAAAAPLYEECVQTCRETLGGTHPNTLRYSLHQANFFSNAPPIAFGGREPRHAEAIALYRSTLAALIEVNGSSHTDTLAAALNLQSVLLEVEGDGCGGGGGSADGLLSAVHAEAVRRRVEIPDGRLRLALRRAEPLPEGMKALAQADASAAAGGGTPDAASVSSVFLAAAGT